MNKNLARRSRRGIFAFSAMLTVIFGFGFAEQTMAQTTKTASAGSGTGGYICTPAGFGQKSKCYRR
ncbi:hypothetical protein [Sulfitobacter indolifex]|uniref:hypothetical protein n=1 Tax=Sulfitobacter indolifex TaxID=225422 RepID=UPI001FACC603|nr:hypothetical protein [Sulfitobacter indolifex]